jgi:aryl-alcohol dehydrogenase-like predicted oxidoreductase
VRNEEESRPFIREALEAGITFFDTADSGRSPTSPAATRW